MPSRVQQYSDLKIVVREPSHRPTQLQRLREGIFGPVAVPFQHGDTVNELSFDGSSRRLMAASSVFKALLADVVREEPGVSGTLTFPCYDTRAFDILLKIIHGKDSEVPRRLDEATLLEVAVLVDKFGLREAVKPLSREWVSSEMISTNSMVSDPMNLLCRMSLFCVFREGDLDPWVIRHAKFSTKFPLTNFNLPIPYPVQLDIDTSRVQMLSSIITLMHDTYTRLASTEIRCSKDCDNRALDTWRKDLVSLGIQDLPTVLYTGISVDGLDTAYRDLSFRYFECEILEERECENERCSEAIGDLLAQLYE
ncbi:hypothetical protein FQN50_005078 [Emmonsiellopsis sp. PD_5]|nr:hypothetical protein FQN50_005078 [Emmonsiellopsis sp. PD_5]